MNSNPISNSISKNDYPISNTSGSIPSPSISSYAQIIHKEKFERTVSEEFIVDAVDKANKALTGEPKKFEFSVHKGFGDLVIKIVNPETNEVITEIPSEKLLDIVYNLQKIIGVIIDERR